MFKKALQIFGRIAQFLGEQVAKLFSYFDNKNDEENLMKNNLEDVSRQTKERIKNDIFKMKERKLSKEFYPQRWAKLSEYEKKLVAQAQIEKLKNILCLTQDYKVKFVNTDDIGKDGFKFNQTESPRVIYLDKSEYILSKSPSASILLYGRLAQEMVYAKQQEILNEEIKVPEKVLQLYKNNYGYGEIHTNQLYFLGEKVEPMHGEGGYYIRQTPGDVLIERDYFNAMQFAEREPKRFSDAKIALLEKRMIQDGYLFKDEDLQEGLVPDKEELAIREVFDMCHETDYVGMRERMNALYQCNVEKELDKAMLNLSLPEEERQKVNFQVQFATSVFQLQGEAELDGREVVDPRRVIINNTHGYIPQMLEKTYERNKGRLEYEGIEVGKIITVEEAQENKKKEYSKAKGKDRGRDKDSRHQGEEDIYTPNSKKDSEQGKPPKTEIRDGAIVTEDVESLDLEEERRAMEAASKFAQMIEEDQLYNNNDHKDGDAYNEPIFTSDEEFGDDFGYGDDYYDALVADGAPPERTYDSPDGEEFVPYFDEECI